MNDVDAYVLTRPGISLIGENSINVPCYPFRYEEPKIGDKVWVIVEKGEDIAIDTDTISDISDYYVHAVNNFNYRKSILNGTVEWPTYEGKKIEVDLGEEPTDSSKYLIDFWLDKYHNGHANCFGETIYSSFEEARSVLVQLFRLDHVEYSKILSMTEEELKPE